MYFAVESGSKARVPLTFIDLNKAPKSRLKTPVMSLKGDVGQHIESDHQTIDKSEIQIVQIADDVEHSKPSATSWMMMRLYATLSVGYFCIILQGYDSSLMGAINAVPEYLDYFHL